MVVFVPPWSELVLIIAPLIIIIGGCFRTPLKWTGCYHCPPNIGGGFRTPLKWTGSYHCPPNIGGGFRTPLKWTGSSWPSRASSWTSLTLDYQTKSSSGICSICLCSLVSSMLCKPSWCTSECVVCGVWVVCVGGVWGEGRFCSHKLHKINAIAWAGNSYNTTDKMDALC